MALAELPPSFRDIALTDAERSAVVRFVAEAPVVAPAVAVIAPRRSSSGHIKIVLEFPAGCDTWQMTGDLVRLVHRIEDETGVYLHLD